MTIFRKLFSAAIAVLVVALSMAVASAKTVIEVWGIPADDLGKNLLAQRFNEIQDQYEIRVVHGAFGFDESPEKLMTAVAAGTAPPVVLLDRMTVAEWAARGALMPLDEIAERHGISKADYHPAVWESSMFDGRLYALPSHFNLTASYFYNVDAFSAAGLDPNRPPATWDEWLEVTRATTITDGQGRITQSGFQFGYHALLYLLSWQNGGAYSPDPYTLTANRPENVEALEFVKQLYEAVGGREAYDHFSSSAVTGTGQDTFAAGLAAATRGGTWMIDVYRTYAPDLNYRVAPMPIPPGGQPANILGGRSMVIMNGTRGEKLEGAIAFVTWVAKEGGRVVWEGGRHLPARVEDYEALLAGDEEIWGLWALNHDTFAKARLMEQLQELPYGRYRPINPVNAYLYDQLIRAWDDVTYGRMTPQRALDEVQRDVQRQLDRFWQTQRGR